MHNEKTETATSDPSQTKTFGKKSKRAALSIISEIRRAAEMENASFDQISFEGCDLPKTEKQVTKFIKKRTRLYRETWILARLTRLENLISGAQDD